MFVSIMMRVHVLLDGLRLLLKCLILVISVQVAFAFHVGLSRSKDRDGTLLATKFLEEMGVMTTNKKQQQCTNLYQDYDHRPKIQHNNNLANDWVEAHEGFSVFTKHETAKDRIQRIRAGKLTEKEKDAFLKIAFTYGRRQRTNSQQQQRHIANTATCSVTNHEDQNQPFNFRRLDHTTVIRPSKHLSVERLQLHTLSENDTTSTSHLSSSSNSNEVMLQSLLSNMKSLAAQSTQKSPNACNTNSTTFSSINKSNTLRSEARNERQHTNTPFHPNMAATSVKVQQASATTVHETTKHRIIRIRNGKMTKEEKNNFLVAITKTNDRRISTKRMPLLAEPELLQVRAEVEADNFPRKDFHSIKVNISNKDVNTAANASRREVEQMRLTNRPNSSKHHFRPSPSSCRDRLEILTRIKQSSKECRKTFHEFFTKPDSCASARSSCSRVEVTVQNKMKPIRMMLPDQVDHALE